MKRDVDVVLINPSSRRQVYQSLGGELAAVEPPLWAALLASYCRGRGISAAIIDAEAEELSPEQVSARVGDMNPLLVAVVVYGHQPSASTQVMTAAGAVCEAVKRQWPEQRVLMVGGHVAALPERTLREEACDFVAAGEGFETLAKLTEALKSGEDPRGAPGLWQRDEDEIRCTPSEPLVTDLDSLVAAPAWDLLPMSRYRAHNWHCLQGQPRQPYAALYTTLGCPYRCSFCCIQAPFRGGERAAGMRGNSYRYWSPQTVLAQIDELVTRYGIRNIKIADEMFVLSRKHVLAICEGLIERDYGLNLWAYARVDTVHATLLDKLRRAGFTWLALGIEAGARNVRADVDKAFEQDEVFEVVGRIREAGINVIGNYIFGLPEDDEATMQATLDLAVELRCEFANFYSAMAYPGSPLYARATKEGIPLPRHWTGYSQHARDCLPLPTRHLTAREVLRFRDEAFVRYYTDAGYLSMMEQRFGPMAAAHLRDMTGKRLQRDLLDGTMDVLPRKLPRAKTSIVRLTPAGRDYLQSRLLGLQVPPSEAPAEPDA